MDETNVIIRCGNKCKYTCFTSATDYGILINISWRRNPLESNKRRKKKKDQFM